jgi:hypothetical protein
MLTPLRLPKAKDTHANGTFAYWFTALSPARSL